jgi:hypothetical protein
LQLDESYKRAWRDFRLLILGLTPITRAVNTVIISRNGAMAIPAITSKEKIE